MWQFYLLTKPSYRREKLTKEVKSIKRSTILTIKPPNCGNLYRVKYFWSRAFIYGRASPEMFWNISIVKYFSPDLDHIDTTHHLFHALLNIFWLWSENWRNRLRGLKAHVKPIFLWLSKWMCENNFKTNCGHLELH